MALDDLNEQVEYVGGAVVSLYINDPAADEVRPTKDIDISLSIATVAELEMIRESLTRKGFIQTAEDNIICRFRYDDVTVDVMNTKAIGWAPANTWFAPGFMNKEETQLENKKIWILPLHYFLASKFEAYNGRGNKEPRMSHDFEDIIYILDNRVDINDCLMDCPADVSAFLKSEFEMIINDRAKREAILGNLYYENRDTRFNRIIENLKFIIHSK